MLVIARMGKKFGIGDGTVLLSYILKFFHWDTPYRKEYRHLDTRN